MSEKVWELSSDPVAMIASLMDKGSKGRGRKLRLFAVACCRPWPQILACDQCRLKVETAERLADGLANNMDRRRVSAGGCSRSIEPQQTNWCNAAARMVDASALKSAKYTYSTVACYAVEGVPQVIGGQVNPNWRQAYERELKSQTALLRDIFGNPFRPVAFSPEWRTSTAVALAQQMYDSRDFALMPILGDALQDAGCDSGDILAHCRGAELHVRGCWIVDLVLGKE